MRAPGTKSLPDRVRDACGRVAARAHSVQIDHLTVAPYAADLSRGVELPSHTDGNSTPGLDREGRVAFVVCLDAINFGSGWWPTIRRRAGKSGYGTVAAGMTARFEEHGAWSASELAQLTAADVADVLDQGPEHPLMGDFAATLKDVGTRLLAEHDGSFEALVDAAEGSAVAMAELLADWDSFADVSIYEEREIPFFKRAQIAAADLDREGVASFDDLDRLTAFADNLVPHVLRVDGVLRLAPELTEAIEAGELLVHGSPQEVELRACAVHAVELLAAARRGAGAGPPLTPAEIDAALWHRGGAPRYKSRPRPRSRNTAY